MTALSVPLMARTDSELDQSTFPCEFNANVLDAIMEISEKNHGKFWWKVIEERNFEENSEKEKD